MKALIQMIFLLNLV